MIDARVGFTEEQIISILQESAAGAKTASSPHLRRGQWFQRCVSDVSGQCVHSPFHNS
jgi:hypothetical protein